jgi:hypothetical protein
MTGGMTPADLSPEQIEQLVKVGALTRQGAEAVLATKAPSELVSGGTPAPMASMPAAPPPGLDASAQAVQAINAKAINDAANAAAMRPEEKPYWATLGGKAPPLGSGTSGAERGLLGAMTPDPAKPPVVAPTMAPDTKGTAAAAGASMAPRMPVFGPMGGGGGARPANPLNALDASDKKVQGALGDVANQAQAAAQAQENFAFGVQATNHSLAETLAEMRAEQAQHMQQARASMAATDAEIRKRMSEVKPDEIDPDKAFGGFGGKMMASIGVALGAFGAAVPHSGAAGRNYAQEIFQHTIDQYVKTQTANNKSKREQQWAAIAKSHELAKDDFARAQWFNDQDDKDRLFANEKAKNAIAGYAAQAQSEEAKVKLAQLAADVTANQEKIQQQMVMRRYNWQQAQAGGGGSTIERTVQKLLEKQAGDVIAARARGETPKELSKQEMYALVQGMSGQPQGQQVKDPLAGVPKNQQEQALKEQQEYEKNASVVATIGALYKQYEGTGLASPRQREAIAAQIATNVKKAAGPGMSSDSDYERFILPNLPKLTDTKETLELKKRTMTDGLRATVATPILDRHAPGWRGGAPQQIPAGATPRGGK